MFFLLQIKKAYPVVFFVCCLCKRVSKFELTFHRSQKWALQFSFIGNVITILDITNKVFCFSSFLKKMTDRGRNRKESPKKESISSLPSNTSHIVTRPYIPAIYWCYLLNIFNLYFLKTDPETKYQKSVFKSLRLQNAPRLYIIHFVEISICSNQKTFPTKFCFPNVFCHKLCKSIFCHILLLFPQLFIF